MVFADTDSLEQIVRQLINEQLLDVLPDVLADNLRLARSRPLRMAGVPTKLTATVVDVGATTATVQLDDDAPGVYATAQLGSAVSTGDRVVILHDPSGGAVIVGNGTASTGGSTGGALDARVVELEQAKALGMVFYPEGFDRVTGAVVALDSGLGALGNGTSDDTISVQAAADAAGVVGGIVWGKPGAKYGHTATILFDQAHTTLESSGAFAAFLKPLAGFAGTSQVQIAANDCAIRNIGFQPGSLTYTLNPAVDCIRIEGLNGGQAVNRTHIDSCSAFFCNGYFLNSQPFGGLLANAQPNIQYVSKCDARDGAGGIRIMGGGSTRSVGGHLESCYMQSNAAPCFDFHFAHDIQVIGCSGGMTGPDVVNGIATMRIHGDCAALNISSTALGAQRNSGSNALLVEKDLSSGDAPFNIDFNGCIFEFAEDSAKVTEGDGINFSNCWFTLAGKSGLVVNGPAVVGLSNCGFNDNATWVNSPPLLSSDSFNRTATTGPMGNTDGSREFEPGAWNPLTGTWGIITNNAYASAVPGGGAPAIAVRDLTETDVDCSIKVVTRDALSGLVVRLVDSLNYFVFRSDNAGNCQLHKIVAGVDTPLGSNHNVGNADGDVLRAVFSGTSVTIYRNGVSLETIVDGTFAAATQFGMAAASIAAQFDNWQAFRNVGSVIAYEIDVQNAAGQGQVREHNCKFSSTDVTAATRQRVGNVVRQISCTNNTGKPREDLSAGYAEASVIFDPLPKFAGGYIIQAKDIPPIPESGVTNLVADLAALQAAVAAGSGIAIYGDASDGIALFDGTSSAAGLAPVAGVYTMTKDLYLADTSALSGSAVLITNGFRVFCRGTLTVGASCSIRNNGAAASGATGGFGAGAGTTGAGANGGNGAVGLGNGTSGAAATTISPSNNALGGTGGAGGNEAGGPGSGGGNGSGGGGGSTLTAACGEPRNAVTAIEWTIAPGVAASPRPWTGGGGGAGGDSTASSSGGGGGGGGGVTAIFARSIVNNGIIRARGGDGGAASGTGTGAGGGGGGGGGVVVLVYNSLSGNAPDAPGGNGGAAQGAGKNGANGGVGRVIRIVNV